MAPNVGPTSNIYILDKFATLAPERGARVGERLSSDFDRRVRSEGGEVAFPFQSFPDNGESAAGRMPAIVHPPPGRHVEFNHGGYVGSEFVNRSSFRRQFQCLTMVLILIIHIWLQFGG